MDRGQFNQGIPGDLVPIQVGRGESDLAFLPHPLPPTWEFSVKLWPLLNEAYQQIGLLEGLGRTLPNPTILLRPLRDREAIQSSRMEGTYATPRQLILFELEPHEPSSVNDPSNEYLEVLNYRQALEYASNSDLPLSLRFIRELHRILLNGVRGADRTPGEFRKLQVAVGAPRRFVPPPAVQLTDCLNSLEQYLHVQESTFDSMVECFLVHYQFEAIHPFLDGNGRVGRLLLTVMLQQKCGLSKPWLYLSEWFEIYREEYIRRLFEVSTKGDWEGWIEFCINATTAQARRTVDRCEQLLQLREKFFSTITTSGGSARLLKIVEGIFELPYVRIADLPARLGVTYPTAKSDVERLVAMGILQELESVPSRTFFAPELFQIAYDDLDNPPNK